MRLTRLGVGGIAALLVGLLTIVVAPARAEDPFCFECHDDFPGKMKGFKFTHDPAAGNECTACHVDHQDEEKLMLVKEGAALCYECHDDVGRGNSVHAPVTNGSCTACHNPHGSSNKMMLVSTGTALCQKCHGSSPEFGRKYSHAALDDGCNECHRPHASENRHLLKKNLVRDRLAVFDPKQAELCFACHDQETFTKPRSEETGFRKGNINLHALHLTGGATANKYGITKKKDGQTCFACHLPHTADQDKLIRTEYQCTGTFCYTMRFTSNVSGGTCIVGCHKPRIYSREEQEQHFTAGVAPAEKPVVR